MSSGNAALTASLQALAKLVEQGAQLGVDIVESLAGSSPQLLDSLTKLIGAGGPLSACSPCDIPPPCWMPRPLCDVTSLGRPGDTASLGFVITNCNMAFRQVAVFTTTPNAGLTFSAADINLTPMERGEILVSHLIPTTAPIGSKREILMWVRGCRLYFLRWTVVVGAIGADSFFEVDVEDCPDPVHHWYDHFYCPRPCLEERGNNPPGTHG
jgi:hypothetical protein